MPTQYRVYAAFFIYALTLGQIYPRLGDLQLQMGVAEGALGAALMGAALGTQIALMFAGPMIERFGYRLCLIVAIPVLGLSESLATLSTSPWFFFFALVIAGFAVGVIEIIVNVEADRTEHAIGKRIMNRSHAFWSFGFFGAGAVGIAMKAAEINPTVHLLGMSVVSGIAAFLVLRGFAPAATRTVEDGPKPRFVMPTPGILMLVGFTLSAMILEGAGADWSVIFMRDVFEVSPAINTVAFALGALTQALTRFFADSYVEKYGPVRVASALVATLGVGAVMVTFAPHPVMALVGFALMGMGTSVVFPLAMSAAAQRTDRPSATNVAALAQLSFVSFLVAPPALGFVAEHFGIRWSFGIGIPLVLVSLMLVKQVLPKASPEDVVDG